MINEDAVRDGTESYLKSAITEICPSLSSDFDSAAPFRELEIDSFHVLKIIKRLEASFGALPKTLLFEHFNVVDLVDYFVNNHAEKLAGLLRPELRSAVAAQPQPAPPTAPTAPAGAEDAGPIVIRESQVARDPELESLIRRIFEQYKNEGSVSRGTRSIAPYLFVGSARLGYLHFGRSKNLLLAYAYTGPPDHFQVLAGELRAYCAERRLRLNIFTDALIDSIDARPFTATPFGVLQRVLNIRDFKLDGGDMRRLRYQVSKFEKRGRCRTYEYQCGSDREVDNTLCRIIDEWCATKAMVNPLVAIVRAEIEAGRLAPGHRLFLTSLDGAIKNVILITQLAAAHDGYLMDLEFYTRDMPLGGLEYAIVRIIEQLGAEGVGMFSLGGTYGCRLGDARNACPEVNKLLDELQTQSIFNDSGNLQFKNKFRPENDTIYLCREAGAGDAGDVIDIIMMIADPTKMQDADEPHAQISLPPPLPAEPFRAPDAEPAAGAEPAPAAGGAAALDAAGRLEHLRAAGFNPLNVPHEAVEWDLRTDSWAQLRMPSIARHMTQLRAQLQRPVNPTESLQEIFPFAHFVFTTSGRTAERAYCRAIERKGVVLQNLLFPTWLFNQIDNELTPVELPALEAYATQSDHPYKGNLAWQAFETRIASDGGAIAFVCIEASNNATGGHPVSIEHLKAVRALLAPQGIPLIIDATRVIENAQFIVENDAKYACTNIWAVVRELLGCADAVMASLAKEFGVNKGGMIATNDPVLFERLQECIRTDGTALDSTDQRLVAVAMQNRKQLANVALRRRDWVKRIWSALKAQAVPVVEPLGGHCVLIDVRKLPQFAEKRLPVASFLAWLFIQTGIRAGAHSVGMQKRTALNELVRLAIPVGLKREQVESITNRLLHAFEDVRDVPDVSVEGAVRESFGDVHTRYQLVVPSVAAPSPAPAARVTPPTPTPPPPPPPLEAPAPVPAAAFAPGREPGDVAIVGMSGRYPKARNLRELWCNLAGGVDCVEEIPEQRHQLLLRHGPFEKYRGGFIDDVDRFDSMFFNISPREAAMLDPQERLFLEVAWEAIEDAGYYPEILARDAAPRNIGVFVGAVWTMYQMLGPEERQLGQHVVPNSFLWSIANRVSYWMNLTGPSLTLDTACSSSLTALYLAVEAIRSGECTGALVGGVNLDLHHHKLDINLFGGALSKDGLCRSFGEGANGYVAGEGVGALFLKPLHQAVEDRDHVYGVIKSIVINHGGKTSGYTVPNPRAQAQLIQSALQKADIDARSIGYIEAHGTGTELGDPIEITGLTNAFQGYRVPAQSCAIGSIKSNIGHLEAAAGVVSVSKVLLQMEHGELVPSLHSRELNKFIDFAKSPFYVEQRVEAWHGRTLDGVQYPRRAGISSFGAGGANAHVVLEQYASPDAGAAACSGTEEHVIPLSARTESQLRDTAVRLQEHLAADLALPPARQQSLRDIAYTLQVGRKSFDFRMLLAARSKQELLEKLSTFIAGTAGQATTGHVKNAEGVSRLLNRNETAALIRLLSERRDALHLAQLWVDGLVDNWQVLQPAAHGKKVSLPTYPFADKRHWAFDTSAPLVRGSRLLSGMHPLIDTNESTFEYQRFKKVFHGKDFFIYDHLVSDVPTLPGVAYLELARKAGEIAAGKPVRKIRNILWVSPIAVVNGQERAVAIELKPKGDSVQFEVFSESDAGKRTLHSQGKLIYATSAEAASMAAGAEQADAEYVDVAALRARCVKVIEGKDAYPLFKSFGLNLGQSFQVLKEVYKNATETLGELELSDARLADLQEMVLHPALVDGSLQAGMAAQLREKATEMLVPFTIGEVEILHPLERNCLSYVTLVKDPKNESSVVSKSNVWILNTAGKVLVKIRESVGVPLRDVHKADAAAAGSDWARLYYGYEWAPEPILPAAARRELPGLVLFDTNETLRDLYRGRLERQGCGSERVVLVRPGESFQSLGDRTYQIDPRNPADFKRLFDELARLAFEIGGVCFGWTAAPGRFAETLERGVYAYLSLCQTLGSRRHEGKLPVVHFSWTTGSEAEPHNAAFHGFNKALHLEHPKIVAKTLALQQESTTPEHALDALIGEMQAEPLEPVAVSYAGHERSLRRLKSFDLDREQQPPRAVLKEHGVYVITGGLGGLGRVFARFLAHEYRARLVLVGRSNHGAAARELLDELAAMGGEALYVAADVSDLQSVQAAVSQGRTRFGEIHGVIHAAGVLRDSYIRNKTAEEMRAVFAPKIHGTLHLDESTREDKLDFFVTFSSLAAVGGNAGQCDYSYANHFMDSFAAARASQTQAGVRFGKTLSVNWSLWAEGGMKIDQPTALLFEKTLGIRPLSSATGLSAFVKGLSSPRTQYAVVEGLQERLEIAWGLRAKAAPAPAAAEARVGVSATPRAAADTGTAPESEAVLLADVRRELVQLVVSLLQVEECDVAIDKILLDLGFDSLGLTTYANAINDKYQLDITPIVFFDHPSIQDVAKYLLAERKDEVVSFHRKKTPAGQSGGRLESGPRTAAEVEAPSGDAPIVWRKAFQAGLPAESAAPAREVSLARRFEDQPIAIVGMSGVMPQSADLEEFWEHLKNGKDLITVIPEDRWDWKEFFGDPLKEVNKSNSKWGGFIKDVDKFDPLFFGISPREAQMMDPQQRIFLETVWKTVEDSGHKVSDLAGTKTGLFVGVATNDYIDLMNGAKVNLDGYSASGNSHSVLANRVSFLLNLRGPSGPLDTACSSSLVAIHRAIEAIHTGSCDMAIVGGVQVMLTPAAYISFGMAGMLSSDGKCKSFDKKADGYVRGEGAGAIFLKPLSMAEADGNHIYAVIRATAENHGGRVTTLTAPNATAQSELLVEAYERARIDPATVGYIECHGTGTSLGDPIEIQALKTAFSELYRRHGKAPPQQAHCGLSSVKTNIGHLETAAGIAGILKALLSIKHQAIPANLHFEEMNPYISLKDSPFFIADKTVPWHAPLGADGNQVPRRVGVSSFGFGGANAHIVLEEYVPATVVDAPPADGPQLVVLSAKGEERLKDYAVALLAHLNRHEVALADLSYTLQVGRDEMVERLALVASSIEELKEKLRAFLRGGSAAEFGYRSERARKKSRPVSSAEEQAREELVRDSCAHRRLAPLAELWVSGAAIDWRLLHQDRRPQRLALPTYPFARDRHWVQMNSSAAQAQDRSSVDKVLHPLLHRNASTLQQQKFSSTFTGKEFFLADHSIRSHAVFPGVAYMEMARVAAEISGCVGARTLRDISWLTPLVVGAEPQAVEISLTPKQAEIEFAVRTFDGAKPIAHCYGRLSNTSATEPGLLDLAGIRAQCSDETIDGAELYSFLCTSELQFGPGFEVVQRVHAGKSACLAVLRLPEHLRAGAAQFGLHPALMDGTLHTAIGLVKKSRQEMPWCLPYSVAEVQIVDSLEGLAYGYATWEVKDQLGEHGLIRMDIQLLDGAGRVLLRMRDVVAKPFLAAPGASPAQNVASAQNAASRAVDLHTLVPVWHAVAPHGVRSPSNAAAPRVLVLGNDRTPLDWVRQSLPHAYSLQLSPTSSIDILESKLVDCSFDQLLWLAPDLDPSAQSESAGHESLVAQQEQGVLSIFRIVKALLQLGYANRALEWTLITRNTLAVDGTEALQPAHAAIAGLMGSLAKERPNWHIRLLDVESLQALTLHDCLSLPFDREGNALAYRRGEWFREELAVAHLAPSEPAPCRHGGVYVVIGGAGGLGEVWTRFMVAKYQAQVVWIGRQPRGAAINVKLAEIARLGPQPLYVSADATDLSALEQAWTTIQASHPRIHGVVHSAIVLRDQSLAHMEEADFRASLAAKVDVSVNLERVFGAQDLDFMLYFSSVISFVKSPGQANYAAGCTFKDGFARSLQSRHRYPVKIMNWGYWGNVGVVANEAYNKIMERQGIGSIEPTEGMAALETLLGSRWDQIALIKTLDARTLGGLNVSERLDQRSVAPAARWQLVDEPLPVERLERLRAELPSSAVESLVTEILASSLCSLGLLNGAARCIADLSLNKQPAAFYERWLQSSVRHLQQRGLLSVDGTPQSKVRDLGELWSAWETVKTAAAANANTRAQIVLLETCLKGLPGVLSGQRTATDILFPQSSMKLVEGIYRQNAVADFFNDELGKTLAACIAGWLEEQPDRKIRILEVGAGTGGTTARLLPTLEKFGGAIAEYCYTDLSKAFLMYAAEHYQPGFAALTTAIFDVSKPLLQQSVPQDRFDIVIAANVLHATPKIRETLRNCKAVLRTQGVLLLNEISQWSLFSHLTFGLLEGWWLNEDTPLRLPGNPGLTPEKWQDVLAAEGFDSVGFPVRQAHGLGQQIVAACSDGVVRQRLETSPQAQAQVQAQAQAQAQVQVQAPTPTPVPTSAQPPPRTLVGRDSPRVNAQKAALQVQQAITDKLAEALKLNSSVIRDDSPFADYGVDSIIGVNLVRMINEALGVDLETTSLFEFSTVVDLAAHILARWPDKVAPPVSASSPPPVRQAPSAVTPIPSERSAAPSAPPYRFVTAEVQSPHTDNAAASAAPPGGARPEPIAIIGMSGRFAESESLEDFWRHLRDGRDLVKEVSRWSAANCVIAASTPDAYCSRGSFVDSFDRFDPAFFRISPTEALYMDPQQRLFLEEAFRALEDAGYAGKAIQEKKCGVYVGCGSSNYDDLFDGVPPPQAFWGNSASVIPARISYHLNLQGPAIAVDTACSSSLVTIHLACQGLWSHETDMALAGGVFLQATSNFYQVSNRAGMLSPDGKCRSFDAHANGFVPGEGVGALVLKRLADALRDADHIHGVIAGSGINQNGSSNGLIAPSARSQEQLERSVYERFNVDPATLQLLEAHGTGTLLGDSIEHDAVSRAFRHYTDRTQFCALGTVKTNIGHAATAAGVASALKVLLALRHRQIPPSLHFTEANPGIDFTNSPFFVNRDLMHWPSAGNLPRRAAVSSFGFSGTNAHLIIEEAPAAAALEDRLPGYVVLVSARTAEQLEHQVQNLKSRVAATETLSLNNLGFSLAVGRSHFSHRLACVARDRQELLQLLEQWIETGAAEGVFDAEIPEGKVRERISLKNFANHCVEACAQTVDGLAAADAAEYLDHLSTLADLYTQGYVLDYQRLFSRGARRMPLPTYPFAMERYWLNAPADGATRARTAQPHQLSPAITAAGQADLEAEALDDTFPGASTGPVQREPKRRAALRSDEKMEQFLLDEIALQLKQPAERIARDQSYFDLGVSSLGIASLIQKTNRLLGANISPRVVFEHRDIQSFAAYLAANFDDKILALPLHERAAGPERKTQASEPLSTEQILERISWQDTTNSSDYEKVTF